MNEYLKGTLFRKTLDGIFFFSCLRVHKHRAEQLYLTCVYTTAGESVEVAGSHSFQCEPAARVVRHVLDGVGVEES